MADQTPGGVDGAGVMMPADGADTAAELPPALRPVEGGATSITEPEEDPIAKDRLDANRYRRWAGVGFGCLGVALIVVVLYYEAQALDASELVKLIEAQSKGSPHAPVDPWIPRLFLLGRAVVAAVSIYVGFRMIRMFDELTDLQRRRPGPSDEDRLLDRLMALVQSVRG